MAEEFLRNRREALAAGIEGPPTAADREAGDGEHRELVVGEVSGEGVLREHRDAHATGNGLLDRFVAAQLHAYARREAGAVEPGVARGAGAGATLAQDEALVGQCVQAEPGLPGQAVLERCDDNQRVGQEGLALDVHVIGRDRHDVEIVAVGAQVGDDAVTVLHVQLDIDLRIALAETAEDARHEVLGGADHGDREAPAREAFHGVDALLEVGPLGHHGAGGAGQRVARRREVQALADHFVERQADGIGQLAQLHRDRGLGDVAGPCGGGDAAVLGHGEEELQLAEAGIHS